MAASMAVSIAWTSPFSRSGRRLAAPDGFASPKAACPHPPPPRAGRRPPTGRRLRVRPLETAAAEELARLAERIERRLGRRAAGELEHAGLSRREVEVLRLDSVGRTNREIAQGLFLSARTIDMHVRHVLTKLDCRPRTEATRRAVELGLLQSRP
jgi:ATP/maltotriose-dependent transcriptional regulator MalT